MFGINLALFFILSGCATAKNMEQRKKICEAKVNKILEARPAQAELMGDFVSGNYNKMVNSKTLKKTLMDKCLEQKD